MAQRLIHTMRNARIFARRMGKESEFWAAYATHRETKGIA